MSDQQDQHSDKSERSKPTFEQLDKSFKYQQEMDSGNVEDGTPQPPQKVPPHYNDNQVEDAKSRHEPSQNTVTSDQEQENNKVHVQEQYTSNQQEKPEESKDTVNLEQSRRRTTPHRSIGWR